MKCFDLITNLIDFPIIFLDEKISKFFDDFEIIKKLKIWRVS